MTTHIFRRGAIVASTLAVVLTLSACGATQSPAPTTSSEATAPLLTLGQGLEPRSWDPAMAQPDHFMPYYQAVYDTLIKREPDGSLSPMLATEWAWSDDRLTLTLTLRDDVVFTDGTDFDATVAKANIENFIATGGPQSGQADLLDSVEATDATTLVLKLSDPDPALEISLSGALGFMASGEALGTEEIALSPVGSGPYVLDPTTTVVGSQISFVRNEDYWGDPLPYDAINFLILSETARINALKTGQINGSVFVSAASYEELERAGVNVIFEPNLWGGLMYLDRDGVTDPALADPRVREAITIAIDREAMIDSIYGGKAESASQIFAPDSPAFIAELDTDKRFDYDPERARELLADAGYEDGVTINLGIPPSFDPAIFTAIEQYLGDVGITMERTEYGMGEYIPAVLRGQHAVSYQVGTLTDDWTTITQYVAPNATWNPFKSETPELNALIDDFQHATTADEQVETGQAVNNYLIDNFWFGVFYRMGFAYGADDTVNVQLQVGQAVPSIYNYTPAG